MKAIVLIMLQAFCLINSNRLIAQEREVTTPARFDHQDHGLGRVLTELLKDRRPSIEAKNRFYERLGLRSINDVNELRRSNRLFKYINKVESKGICLRRECNKLYDEIRWRYNDSGCLAFNRKISSLDGTKKINQDELCDYNFSSLFHKYLHDEELDPSIMWELFRQWPWPSDHLIASSVVDIEGYQLHISSMNLLKKGFDDNRLQTSQGLGGHLASRHLKRDESGKFILDEENSKDWDLAGIREKAQMRFIEGQIFAEHVDLLGLQEVSTLQVGALREIADRYNYKLISTNSGRVSKDPLSGKAEENLQDVGVILVNLSKFRFIDSTYSHYISKSKANKHITTALLEHLESGKYMAFTNTHADFGKICDLSEHIKAAKKRFPVDCDWVVAGDMNASSLDVRATLRKGQKECRGACPMKRVIYSHNTPGHIGFEKGCEGEVVDYDQIYLISNDPTIRIFEYEGIHEQHRQYAKDYYYAFKGEDVSITYP